MLTLLIIFMILTFYYLKVQKQLQKDKHEKRWFFLLSFLSVAMAIIVFFQVPVHLIIQALNDTFGEITKHVIKL